MKLKIMETKNKTKEKNKKDNFIIKNPKSSDPVIHSSCMHYNYNDHLTISDFNN